MGIFSTILTRKNPDSTIKSIGNLANDIRGAITGEIPPDKKAVLLEKILDVTIELARVSSSVVIAEAQGQSWLQRNWRPLTMISFLILVILDSFGLLPFRLAKEAWVLLQIGLGGYVVGRTAEKVVSHLNRGG